MDARYKDDPTATYRGYRRQALYCLYRLFDDGLSEDTVIQPEGNEDLAIRQIGNRLLEVVQVKDYSADLTASAFKPSFYRRISDLCTNEASVVIKIVSFGPIGLELAKAYDNEQKTPTRPMKTLTKDREEKGSDGKSKIIYGLSERQAEAIFKRVEIEKVDEDTLTQHVIAKLTATMTSGNPEIAFENLMWWLISSAENQLALSRSRTIEKLTQLGKFITYRDAHAQEWNVSIKPIESAPPDDEARERLRLEFFQGGRVRAEHVAAGLDVPRDQAIAGIHAAFQSQNVVILRGASGQGKTTLAYRYLLDWAPADFRYQVEKAGSLEHARLMAAAIAGHAENIDVPSVIYIDVRPGDTFWVEFVRELAGLNGIRVLVTIREEDWFRSRVSPDDFSFADISVEFTNESASQVFDELRSIGYGNEQLDFKDAWARLGERKTLFEFVYLITQNEQLSKRIQAQIGVLKDEVNSGILSQKELHLLRLVAVASAYEARLDLKGLADFVKLPEPTRTLERFGNEYLLRTSTDGKYVEGFHAIRSEIIAEELTDDVLQPRGTIESQLPPVVMEDDLENFLLCSFSRNEGAAAALIHGLRGIHLNTWVGVRAVLAALQWLGIKRYSFENMELIEEARSLSPTSWWITLDWDLAQVKGRDGFEVLKNLAKSSKEFAAAATVASSLQERQSNKDNVFELAREWLKSFPLPANPADSVSQFTAAGEVLYWLGHLDQQHSKVAGWLDDQAISKAWRILPLHLFARFAAGVYKFNSDAYNKWLGVHRDAIEERIRLEARIIALAEEDDCLVAHFVIDIDRRASALKPSEQETSVNDLSVQRVEILSACFPGYARYGASGYGHQMSLFESWGDDATKRMRLENITMPWLPEFNGLARGAAEYGFRPNTWEEYFEKVRGIRKRVVTAFENLRQILTNRGNLAFLKSADWDECKRLLNADFLLPKSAVDEWGFVSESHAGKFMDGKAKRFTAISTLDPFNKAFNEYTRTLRNFFTQSLQALVLVPNLNLADSEKKRGEIIATGKKLGVSEQSIRRSVVNGMDACIALREMQNVQRSLGLERRIDFDEVFATSELDYFLTTMRSWVLFCYPEQVLLSQAKHKQKKRRQKKPRHQIVLRDCLQATMNRISHALKNLKADGIDARVLSEAIHWNDDPCLWISFDTAHPLESLVAIERLWKALVDAFRPDRDKIVRIKVVDFFWAKIVLVPLVQGRSLERLAFANMKGASYPLDEAPETQLWRFVPEEIPAKAWDELGLSQWDHGEVRRVFDEFAAAYGALFQHVDHMADFSRCKVDLDENGEKVFLDYVHTAARRAEPFVQATFDSCAALLHEFPELNEPLIRARPNMWNCMNIIVQMEEALRPSDDFGEEGTLTIDVMADWRNRLRAGMNLLGEARALWIADSLGLPGGKYSTDMR